MPNLFIIKGKGEFTDNEGKTVYYPINKLVLENKRGNTLEIKLDKINKKLIENMFCLEKDGSMTQDDNGFECDVYTLQEH